MTAPIIERVERALSARMAVWVDSDSELIGMPWDLGDGEPVVLGVERVEGDVYNVTDRGLAASSLTSAGLDLTKRVPASSFAAIRSGIGGTPLLGHRPHEYELGSSADGQSVGDAVVEIAEAVLRADALRVLAKPPRRMKFASRIIRLAGELELTVHPRARIPLRYAHQTREVSCQVIGRQGQAFIQAIGSGPGGQPYDHARSIFSDAESGVERMTVIEGGAPVEDWQREALSQVSLVVDEIDLRGEFERFAA